MQTYFYPVKDLRKSETGEETFPIVIQPKHIPTPSITLRGLELKQPFRQNSKFSDLQLRRNSKP